VKNRIVKFTAENEIRLFKEEKLGHKGGKLRKELKKLETTGKPYVDTEDTASLEENGGTQTEENGKRKRNDLAFELEIPKKLKKDLYDDYVKVVKEGKLYEFGDGSISIQTIIKQYLETLQLQTIEEEEYEIVKTVMDGIIQFFDGCIENSLLYENERKQFTEEMTKREKKKSKEKPKPSLFYGYPHLLRLCYRLPEILSILPEEMHLRQSSTTTIFQKVEGLFNYLQVFDSNVK